jgi:hypothetical protein
MKSPGHSFSRRMSFGDMKATDKHGAGVGLYDLFMQYGRNLSRFPMPPPALSWAPVRL